MTDRIREERTYAAPPARIYETLTDPERFGAMTGAPAEIDPRDGGTFACFGGAIHGRTIEREDGKRLVQAWRVKGWDEGQYSLVRFELEPEGEGTKLVLEHCGFPEGQGEHLAQGWRDRYLDPLAAATG